MNIKISKTPKIITLDDCISETLLDSIINDILMIIINYFYKCNGCDKYFNKKHIIQCKCGKIWCERCQYVNTSGSRCNKCNDNDTRQGSIDRMCKCIITNCANNALFGNELYPIYCRVHSINKLLISFEYKCFDCINCGIYSNLDSIYCKQHKKDNSKLFLFEGHDYKNKNKQTCNDCKNDWIIIHTCSCGIKRCGNCSFASNFYIKYVDLNTRCVCNKCIYNYIDEPNIKQSDHIYHPLVCAVSTCNNECDYYKQCSYYCSDHHPENSVVLKKLCRYTLCCAICFYKSDYCKYHNEQLKAYNL